MTRATALVFLLIGVLAAGCHPKAADDGGDDASKPIDVQTTRATTGTVSTTVEGFGSLSVPTNQTATLASATGGRVQAVYAKVGDHVQVGELLVTLQGDPTVQADLAKARIAAEQAKRERDRQAALVKAGVAPAKAAEDAQSAYAAAEADLAQKEQTAKLASQSTQLRSPIAGVVTSASVSIGAVLAPQGAAMTVSNLSGLWAEIAIPSDQLPHLKSGMPADVTLDSGATLSGRVVNVDRVLSPDTQRGTVRIALAKTPTQAQPGEFARARIVTGQEPAVLVPAASIVLQDAHQQVYVVAGAKAVARPVQTGPEKDGMQAVQGVKAGETVITEGAAEVSDGAAVKVSEAHR